MERWVVPVLLILALAASPGRGSGPPPASDPAIDSSKATASPERGASAPATHPVPNEIVSSTGGSLSNEAANESGPPQETAASPGGEATTPPPLLDPSARLLEGSDASEYWTLFIDLESGHRITQRFLLTNAGPGDHTAVAVGHLTEPGRAPYRYENGRRRSRWTLSRDRLFFDIAASHLDMHRPEGELRISKQDVEIQLFFEFGSDAPALAVPRNRLPSGYRVEVLAAGAATRGTLRAPWMTRPIETTGRTWLVHTWTREAEAERVWRRVEIFGHDPETAIYGLQVEDSRGRDRAWMMIRSHAGKVIESGINIPARWLQTRRPRSGNDEDDYPLPGVLSFSGGNNAGRITLDPIWLRFDPLSVIPQPFRWFIRRSTQPQEVWADARIDVTLSIAPGSPSLPIAGERESEIRSNSKRETEDETAERSVTGVASITFLNPSERR